MPRHPRSLSQWLRRGGLDRGPLVPTTAGVPPGGSISPAVSQMVVDGLAPVVHGSHGQRRGHNRHDVRWADDCIGPAHARQVLEDTVLPRINAGLAVRRGRLSPTKTVIPPSAPGFDC